MKDSPQPAKRRRYDAAFRAEALRLASESRSTQAAARALNIDPKRLYKWQKEALMALVKSLVQRLNERSLGGRVNASYCAEAGARKVRLAGPRQWAAVMPVEMGPESGTTYASCWPHLVDLFGPLLAAASYFFALYSSPIQRMACGTTSAGLSGSSGAME